MRSVHRAFLVAAVALILGQAGARAEETRLKAIMFPGLSVLGLFVAQDEGFLAKRGLAVDTEFTPSSDYQRRGMAEGKFQIAHSAVDNAVYMVDTDNADAIVVAGGDNSMNDLIVQPDIHVYADIRGKAVVVDAVNTAYAFQLYKMLAMNGLKKGDYTVLSKGGTTQRLEAMRADRNNAAGMMSPPFNIQAKKEGFHSLGTVAQIIGPYQGNGIFVMRSWAKANGDTLVKYLAAIIEADRWAFNPANRAALTAILSKRLKFPPEILQASIEAAVGPSGELAKDARLDPAGFKETLQLRAEFAGAPGASPPPDKYIDLSYYQKALAGL